MEFTCALSHVLKAALFTVHIKVIHAVTDSIYYHMHDHMSVEEALEAQMDAEISPLNPASLLSRGNILGQKLMLMYFYVCLYVVHAAVIFTSIPI